MFAHQKLNEDDGPKARFMPAWASGPGRRRAQTLSANGAIHPCGIVRDSVRNDAWRCHGPGIRPLLCLRFITWDVAPRGLAERGHDGSRGLQSTEWGVLWSRVAERRLNAAVLFDRSVVAPRRRKECLVAVRGLKPTATIVVSLRETGRKCPNSSADCKSAIRQIDPMYREFVPRARVRGFGLPLNTATLTFPGTAELCESSGEAGGFV
jgi:hypothetical protein